MSKYGAMQVYSGYDASAASPHEIFRRHAEFPRRIAPNARIRADIGRHPDCNRRTHDKHPTSSQRVQVFPSNAVFAVAAVAGSVAHAVELRARRHMHAASELGALPHMRAMGTG
jgi:hypothetical protein